MALRVGARGWPHHMFVGAVQLHSGMDPEGSRVVPKQKVKRVALPGVPNIVGAAVSCGAKAEQGTNLPDVLPLCVPAAAFTRAA